MSTTTNPSSSSSAGTGGSGGGGGGGPCGACKFLRRKCVPGCVFAPYFDAEQGATHFAAVHKVFGASNVSKLLLHIPVHKRLDAVITICYEAQARLRDPVYGCVSHIFALQQQVVNLQAELSYLQAHLATLELPPPQPQPEPQPNLVSTTAPPLSISDLPSSTAAYDLFTLFDPTQLQSSSAFSTWTMQPRQVMDQPRPQQFVGGSSGGGADLPALARELLARHHESPPQPLPPPPCSNVTSSHTVSKGDH